MDYGIKGKVALVGGASQGIGRACAEALAREGARVAMCARREDILVKAGEDLVLSLIDFAPTIDLARVKPRDLDDVRPGGLGTHLIRKVMDSADFIDPPPGCGNLLRMVKRIA